MERATESAKMYGVTKRCPVCAEEVPLPSRKTTLNHHFQTQHPKVAGRMAACTDAGNAKKVGGPK